MPNRIPTSTQNTGSRPVTSDQNFDGDQVAMANTYQWETQNEELIRRPVVLGQHELVVEYSSLYESLLTSDGGFRADWVDLLSRELLLSEGSDRASVEFRSVPLLVLKDQNRLLVYSFRGNSESFSKKLEKDLNPSADLKAHWAELEKLVGTGSVSDIHRLTKLYGLPNFNDASFREVYAQTIAIERELKKRIGAYHPTLIERVSDYGLNLTAHYSLIRIHLLKFLAILPSLDHDTSGVQVKRILLETIRRLRQDQKRFLNELKGGAAQSDRRPLPGGYLFGASLIAFAARFFPARPLASVIRLSVRWVARRFIAGETIEDSTESLVQLRKTGRDATLDQLGELVVSEKEADQYRDRVLRLIRGLSASVPKGERNAADIPAAHVSIKVSALCSEFIPEAFDHTFEKVAPRLREILLEAKSHEVFINIDAEHYHARDLIFEIYRKVLLTTPDLDGWRDTGIVVQAYLRDAYTHLLDIAALAQVRGVEMPIRLVKGAYWDAETIEADAHSFSAPQFLNKEETDVHFRQLVFEIFELSPSLKLCLASHNIYDHAFARALKAVRFPELPEFEHQCLHMTYEALSVALRLWGVPVRNYVPVGSLLVGMAYLVRRIMENSSQVGFLSKMRDDDFELTRTPLQIFEDRLTDEEAAVDLTVTITNEFLNAAPVRLYRRDSRDAFFCEMSQFYGLGLLEPGQTTGEIHEIRSPSDPTKLVGSIRFANRKDVESAVGRLSGIGPWRASTAERSLVLSRAAEMMVIERLFLATVIIQEAGKSLNEALADVDEAIDFLKFYAREAVSINEIYGTAAKARGLVTVIAPWNFPLAIPCGMTVAALAAGNSVILKSSEQTPLIAELLVRFLHGAGVPRDVLVHLPGDGLEVGAPLVEDARVAGIVFTGSKAVGTWIARTAGRRVFGGSPVKVITEMGGKNAVIVTGSAELDETVDGLLYSAFAHAGQKCSALSRVLVDESVSRKLQDRLKEAAADLTVGAADHPATKLNPVISAEDQQRLRKAARQSVEEAEGCGGEVVIDRSNEKLSGYSVGPVIIRLPADIAEKPKSMAQVEHFGPVVHFIPYRSLEEAVRLANGTEYALTGGVFSQSQDEIDFVTSQIEVGNFYVNRSNTGARVAIEPFGGFKQSGTGPKAGGRDYLKSFYRLDRTAEIQMQHAEKGISSLGDQNLLRNVERLKGRPRVNQGWIHFLDDLAVSWSKLSAEGVPNRKIPGQVSVDNLGLRRPDLVWSLASSGELERIELQIFAAAVLLEVPVTLVGSSSLSMEWKQWLEIFDSVQWADNEDSFSTGSTFLLSESGDALVGRLEQIYSESRSTVWMPLVLTAGEGPNVNDVEGHIRALTLPRSMAVNTMRHGAPLELASTRQ